MTWEERGGTPMEPERAAPLARDGAIRNAARADVEGILASFSPARRMAVAPVREMPLAWRVRGAAR